jgi:hypothetical protein
VPGLHNLSNALAALAAATAAGVPLGEAVRALEGYAGLARRFDVVGTSPSGVTVIDDFAHHPSAIALTIEGLRARLFKSHVSVTDIRPGFIATPMTAHLQLPAALVAQPADIAPRIVAAIERGTDVVYTPAFWWLILFVVRYLPGFIFKRMKL